MTTKSYHGSRTRASTWVPRRAYYVLRHLQRALTPGKPQAISNKQIQTAIRFGSEGEVSQIMRWLSGEQPTMGRWAAGYLQANAQQYRFITREPMPSGGYLVTLLVTPERIDAPALRIPQIVQLSFFGDQNDPPVIPHAPRSDAPQGGSFSHDPFDRADPRQHSAAKRQSQRDQHEETPKIQNQEKESARSPLLERLLAHPRMDRRLAQQIADKPAGTLADFEADLKIAESFATSPFFFTVAKWRDGQRVLAPEVCHDRPTQPDRARTRAAQRQPDATRTAPPERGPVRTQLIY